MDFEKKKIDVVLLTKNSVKPCLEECLISVKKEVSFNRFIVIDGGSTDGTVELCKTVFPQAEIILDSRGNRATARQIGIEAVTTEWFLFMDSDVVLESDWYINAMKYTSNPKIGAVQGSTIQRHQSETDDFQHAMMRIRRRLGGLTYKAFLAPEYRGFTGDIIIKTRLLEDIHIPSLLHIFEDHYIKKWIENKGFIWFRAPDARCVHNMGYRRPKISYSAGYIGYQISYLNLKRSVLACVTIFPKVLLAMCMRPNLKMAMWQIRFQLYSFIGVFKARLLTKQRPDIRKVLDFKYGTRKEILKEYPVI